MRKGVKQVTFSEEQKPTIIFFNTEQPSDSKNICDPTSVIENNNKTYLITAETVHPWFCDEDYINRIIYRTNLNPSKFIFYKI